MLTEAQLEIEKKYIALDEEDCALIQEALSFKESMRRKRDLLEEKMKALQAECKQHVDNGFVGSVNCKLCGKTLK